MPATNFKVRNMSPGSVMVDIRVLPNPSRGFDPEHVVKDLEAQADDAQHGPQAALLWQLQQD